MQRVLSLPYFTLGPFSFLSLPLISPRQFYTEVCCNSILWVWPSINLEFCVISIFARHLVLQLTYHCNRDEYR